MATLLLAKYDAGTSIAGDASACQFALSLPEQIYRIWAWWKLGLNYYHAPSTESDIWDVVEHEWPTALGEVQRAQPDSQFPSFFAFAFFATARWQRQRGSRGSAPEETFRELQSALSAFESVRTGRAHGVCITSKRQRNNYFALIERWLGSLLKACPESVTREELQALTEPLPVVAPDGSVRW